LGSAAEEVFGMLVVIFCADPVAGERFQLGKLKVLLVSIQQALPRWCSTSIGVGEMVIIHDRSEPRGFAPDCLKMIA
jgi:hypothetical protein